MCIEAMIWAWDQPLSNTHDKFVLIALADGAFHDGSVDIKFDKLRHVTALSSDEIQQSIARLMAAGHLCRDAVKNPPFEYYMPFEGAV